MDMQIQGIARARDCGRLGHRAHDRACVRPRGCTRRRLRRRRKGARRPDEERPCARRGRVRRRGPDGRGTPVRQRDRHPRRPRRLGQQRRHRRPHGRMRRRGARRLATHARGQPDRTIPVRAAGNPVAEGEQQREHREPLVGGRPIRLSDAFAVCGVQMGRRRIHEGAVRRARPVRHTGQCDLSQASSPVPGSTRCSRTGPRRAGSRRTSSGPRASPRRRCAGSSPTDDIANAIVFLASPCGGNISGHALPIDADLHALV